MALINLFQKNVPVSKVSDEDLRKTKMDLQMARSQSRQTMERLEQQKQTAWEKAIQEKNKDLRRSYLNEIATNGFKMQLERRVLDSVEGQIRLVSVVETIKDFMRRRVQSPLLNKLVNLRLTDLDKEVQNIVREGFTGDSMAAEIIQRWGTGFAMEGSEEIQELERLIDQVEANAPAGADVKEMAQQVNQKHNEILEKRTLPA